MDSLFQRSSSLSAILLIFGVLVGAVSPNTTSKPAFAQSDKSASLPSFVRR